MSKNVNYLQKGIFFFAVLLVTAALIGCGGGSSDPAVVQTELEGNFAYLDISTNGEVGETTSAPGWSVDDQSVSYSIERKDGTYLPDSISIDANGQISVNVGDTPDTADSGEYTVTATGTGNFKDSLTATIYIAVEAVGATAISGVLSYGTSNTVDGIFGGSDPVTPDFGDARYSMIPALPSGITLDTTTGAITVGVDAAVQTATDYTVSVLRSGSVGTKIATVSITVNEKEITGTLSYDPVNTTYGTEATSSTTWDPVLGDQTVSYTISPADVTGISIDAGTGEVTVGTDAVAASATGYTVTATGTGNYTGEKTATITITVSDPSVDSTPPGFTSSGSASFAENGTGTVYTAVATDDESTVAYSLESGTGDNNLFGINSSSGAVTFNTVPDYENPADGNFDNVYSITVTATSEGGSSDLAVTITVTNEVEPITGTLSYDPINTTYGTEATSSPTWDPVLSDQTVSYTIIPALPNGITMANGVVTVGVDAAVAGATDYTVTATGTGNYSGEKIATITITVSDGTPPNFTSLGFASFNENATGTVYTAVATDDESSVAYSLESGTGDNGLFTIGSTSGAVTFNSVPDYENPLDNGGDNIYNITVTATSEGGSSDLAVAITVINVIEVDPPLTGSLSYTDITTTYGTVATAIPALSNVPEGGTNNFLGGQPTGISIDAITGIITVSATAPVGSTGYSVILTKEGYQGQLGDNLIITVGKKAIEGTLSYNDITVDAGTSGSSEVNWVDPIAGQTVTYFIANLPNGISIDADGTVTVGTDAVVAPATDYTVTATGIGNFSSTLTGTVNITVNALLPTIISGSSQNLVTLATDVTGWLNHANNHWLAGANNGLKSADLGGVAYEVLLTGITENTMTFSFDELYKNGSIVIDMRDNSNQTYSTWMDGSTIQLYANDIKAEETTYTIGSGGEVTIDFDDVVEFDEVVITLIASNGALNDQIQFLEMEILGVAVDGSAGGDITSRTHNMDTTTEIVLGIDTAGSSVADILTWTTEWATSAKVYNFNTDTDRINLEGLGSGILVTYEDNKVISTDGSSTLTIELLGGDEIDGVSDGFHVPIAAGASFVTLP